MGFCTADEHHRFVHQCPIFERMLVEDGVLLRKYWFSAGDAEQDARFRSRLRDQMMVHTDIVEAPWYVVESDDKRRARINMIAHLLSTIDYGEVTRVPLKLPKRPVSTGCERLPRDARASQPSGAGLTVSNEISKMSRSSSDPVTVSSSFLSRRERHVPFLS
jgi:hypothetical protein